MNPKSEAAEAASRVFHIDGLARRHISRDVTTRVRTRPSDGITVYTVTRPVGAGRELVAYGDYDDVILQLTSRRDPRPAVGEEQSP